MLRVRTFDLYFLLIDKGLFFFKYIKGNLMYCWNMQFTSNDSNQKFKRIYIGVNMQRKYAMADSALNQNVWIRKGKIYIKTKELYT